MHTYIFFSIHMQKNVLQDGRLEGLRTNFEYTNFVCNPMCSAATFLTTCVLCGTKVIIGPGYHRSKNTIMYNNSLDSCLFTS